ncbi:hypothetical protein DSO57_1000903 [Entomophthora muscae]|uniref:Uncharacterized protein n=1 Tax=Entomophthora muscae TaxID=34485 RepID=A0ACC2SY55_9FUNG|nr:hypothetical protein DSO57_1000903 [Entomophthora muscae]
MKVKCFVNYKSVSIQETTLSKTGLSLYYSVNIKSVNMATVDIIIVDMGAVAFAEGEEFPKLKAKPTKSLHISIFEGHIEMALMAQFTTPINPKTSLAVCAFAACATGQQLAKSMALMMYFLLAFFYGIGPTMLRAHTLKGN